MFVEIAKPVALASCLLSLCAVFNAAFLTPSLDMHDRIFFALDRLAVAAALCMIGSLIFRAVPEWVRSERARLAATLPGQIFCWATGVMLVLFLIAWYLETHGILYRQIHF